MMKKKRLLVMTDWFRPGFKAGGTITTCHNLVILLEDVYDIHIMTSDRDLGDKASYNGITTDRWIDFTEKIRIFYATPKALSLMNIMQQVNDLAVDFIYLNSMYSLYFTIYPLALKRFGSIKQDIYLSPSGMLQSSALKRKSLKKKMFLFVLNLFKIQNVVHFHAADEQEKKDIIKAFGKGACIYQIYYTPILPVSRLVFPRKKAGEVTLVFISRIHPLKNLYFLLECLSKIENKIELNIIGPVEDESYFSRCKELAGTLPGNITVAYIGAVANACVASYLEQSHFLALPTAGENFGYAILEAFSAGRPVIISNKTPWKNLEKEKMGWDLPVNDYKAFISALIDAANMVQDQYNEWCESSWNFACRLKDNVFFRNQYCRMFDKHGG